MRSFFILILVAVAAFSLTLGLDVFQHKLIHPYPGKQTIVFASTWAPGEPMQQAYEELFNEFEKEFPQYKIDARWDGRYVLPTLRPRFLTGSDIPDILNIDREPLTIIVQNGYAEPLDDLLEHAPHPDDAGKVLRQAFNPLILERGRYDPAVEAGDHPEKFTAGTYMLPCGVWTQFFFYNRVDYENLGLKPPKTWSQFLENCRKLKAAGKVPIASDEDTYGEGWWEMGLRRVITEEDERAAIAGKYPDGKPGPRWDQDPRIRAVAQAIRDSQRDSYYMAGWKGSIWPSAQRRWVTGEATHMLCGSWLVREVLTYHADPKTFRLGAFLIPQIDQIDWKGQPAMPLPPGEPTGVDAMVVGHVLLRGAKNREGAITLLRFLARRQSAGVLARIGREIPPVIDAPFPPELEDIREDFQAAKNVYHLPAIAYAPNWKKFVWKDLYHNFFMSQNETMSVDDYLKKLQEGTDKYNAKGGEEGMQ